jgi:hypothetical protein
MTLGFVKCGLPKSYIKSVKNRFPNAGFHKRPAPPAWRWSALWEFFISFLLVPTPGPAQARGAGTRRTHFAQNG